MDLINFPLGLFYLDLRTFIQRPYKSKVTTKLLHNDLEMENNKKNLTKHSPMWQHLLSLYGSEVTGLGKSFSCLKGLGTGTTRGGAASTAGASGVANVLKVSC